MRIALLAASLALLGSGAFAAQSALQIQRSVSVERSEDGARVIEPARTLRSGDKVVMVVRWDNADEKRRLLLSSRVPRDLAFRSAGQTPHAVSADGGANWAPLGAVKRGARLARNDEITDLRWRLPASRGTLTWSAVVR